MKQVYVHYKGAQYKRKRNTTGSDPGYWGTPQTKRIRQSVSSTGSSGSSGYPVLRLRPSSNKSTKQKHQYYGSGSRTMTEEEEKKKKKRRGSVSQGLYVGKFRNPTKVRSDLFTGCREKGYVMCEETFGTFGNQPHCCYFLTSTWNLDKITKALMGAMIRAALKKAGITLKSHTQEIPAQNYFNSEGATFEYRYISKLSQSVGFESYICANDESLQTVVDGWTGLRDRIKNYMTGATFEAPFAICFLHPDRTDTTSFYNTQSTVDLSLASFYMPVRVSQYVQNRTPGENNPTNNDADVIDQQPAVGSLYQFAHADPRVKLQATIPNIQFMDRVGNNGSSLIGATSLGGDWQNPPPPRVWQNCTKSSNVLLQPGNSKAYSYTYIYSGTFKNMYKFTTALTTGTSSTATAGGVLGRSALLGLSEKIRTPETNLLTFKYETKYEIGCFIKTKTARHTFMPKFVATQQDVLPA